jgi:hypothetical protein
MLTISRGDPSAASLVPNTFHRGQKHSAHQKPKPLSVWTPPEAARHLERWHTVKLSYANVSQMQLPAAEDKPEFGRMKDTVSTASAVAETGARQSA